METFIGSMITIFVVSLVMSLLTKNKTDKKTSSIYKFTVRPGSACRYIAILCTAFFIGLLVLSYFVGEQSVTVYVGFGVFAAVGLFLLIETLPGAEEIHVDHDDIEVQLAWFYKKHWSFSQIDYTVSDPNKGTRVYMKGRKRQAFVVDNMFTGITNFEKRLKHDNIEIRVKTHTPEEIEKIKKKWDIASWLLVIGIVLVCAIVYVLLP
mgnify:FL=1